MTICFMQDQRQQPDLKAEARFDTALDNQNMPRQPAAPATRPLDYTPVPLRQATPYHVYAGTADSAAPITVNPLLHPLSEHPALVLKNEVEAFHEGLQNTEHPFLFTAEIQNYSENIHDLLSIPTKHHEAKRHDVWYRSRASDVEATKNSVQDMHDVAKAYAHQNAKANWNIIDGEFVGKRRKGAPSLMTLAAAQVARLKAEGENLSAWEEHPVHSTLLHKSLANVGSEHQQIGRFIAHITSDALNDKQKRRFIKQLNHYFKDFLTGSLLFTMAELSTAPERFMQAVHHNGHDFMTFMMKFQSINHGKTPLQTYYRTATYSHLMDNVMQSDSAKGFQARLETVPVKAIDDTINDFAEKSDLFRQQFRQQHPNY